MDYDDPFAPIAFESHGFRKDPKRFLLPIATAHLYHPKTPRMLTAQFCCHLINPPPLLLPKNMARTLQLTHPVFSFALDESGQLQSQHAIIKGIVRLGEVPFLFYIGNDLDHHLGSLLVREPMLEMMEEFQEPLARLSHLLVTRLDSGLQIDRLLFLRAGVLDLELNPVNQGTVGHDRRHHRLKSPHPSGHIIIALRNAVNLRTSLMMK